jgi:hypothetical protein
MFREPTLTSNALSFDLPVTLFKSEAFSRLAGVGPISPPTMLLRRAAQAKLALHASGSATLR